MTGLTKIVLRKWRLDKDSPVQANIIALRLLKYSLLTCGFWPLAVIHCHYQPQLLPLISKVLHKNSSIFSSIQEVIHSEISIRISALSNDFHGCEKKKNYQFHEIVRVPEGIATGFQTDWLSRESVGTNNREAPATLLHFGVPYR